MAKHPDRFPSRWMSPCLGAWTARTLTSRKQRALILDDEPDHKLNAQADVTVFRVKKTIVVPVGDQDGRRLRR